MGSWAMVVCFYCVLAVGTTRPRHGRIGEKTSDEFALLSLSVGLDSTKRISKALQKVADDTTNEHRDHLNVSRHGGQHRSAETNRRGAFSKQCQPYPNKRVVLVTVNSDFVPMFENWFHFAKVFLQSTEQLYVISEDDAALQPLHKLLDQSGVDFTIGGSSGEVALSQAQAPYNSARYGGVVWKRPQRIVNFLRADCTVLYSDVDNVWAKDPFREFEVAGSHDLYLTIDSRPKRKLGYCTCFMYLHPTAPIIKLMDDWAGRETGLHNQPLFNSELQKSGMDFGVLPFDEFPPGFMKVENATVFHANYVIGEKQKVQWLRSRGLWWVNATA